MGLMKKLTSAIVASSLVFSLAGSAFAATTPAANEAAGNRMLALQILKGKYPNDALALNDHITRAELVTIIVRAFGKEADAQLLTGAAAFPDSASHWASGNIAMAKNLVDKAGSDAIGMPDGSFAPQGEVTPAQAVAFLMKFMGVKRDAAKVWPYDYLDKAAEIGLITTADKDALAADYNTAATRGLVFSLFDSAFYSYKFADGKTFYTKYVDPSAPVLKVDNAATATTTDSKVTITGTVSDASELYVGSAKVTPDANGQFSYDYDLSELKDYSIAVIAKDVAGNKSEYDMTVSRTTGEATALSAPASIEVVAGQSADVAAAVKDANGNAIKDITISGTSDLGSFADGKFTAGEKAGAGELTLTAGGLTATVNVTVKAAALAKVVVSPATLDLNAGTSQKFTAVGQDSFGNEVPVSDVTWSASKGVMGVDGTFGATADATGAVTVTATSNGIAGTAAVTVFGTPVKVQIAAPAELVADNESEVTVTATVLDANGNVARNYNGTVTFTSSAPGVASVETASVDAVNGVATTTLKAGSKSGSTVLSASAAGLTGTTLTYSVAAQTLTAVNMSVDPGSIAAKTSSYGAVKFTLVDQNGNKLTKMHSGLTSLKVKVTTSDADVVTFNGATVKEYTLTAPEATFSTTDGVRGTSKIGTATLTGVVTTSGQTGLTVSATTVSTMIVGDSYAVTLDTIADAKASDTSKVYFRVVDFNGNQLTTTAGDLSTANYDVEISKDGTAISAPIGMVTESAASYGKGTFTINWSKYAPTSGSAGVYTVKVKPASATGISSAEATAVVTPASASKLTMTSTPSTISANGVATSKLVIKVKDAYNNLVTDGSYDVKVTRTGAKVTSAANEQTLTTSAGVAELTVTATTKLGTDNFAATNDNLSTATASVTTAILGAPNKVVVVDTDAVTDGWQGYAGTAGKEFNVDVAVADANGNTLTDDNGTPVSIEIFDGSDSLGTFSGTTENGVASIPVTLTKANSTGFKVVATSGSLIKNEVATAVTVAAAAPASLAISSDVDVLATSTATVDSQATLTVTLKDAYGNTAKAGTNGVRVYVRANDATYGTIIDGTAATGEREGYNYKDISSTNSTASFTYEATRKAGSITVEAIADDLTDGTLSFESKIAGSIDDVTVVAAPSSTDVSDVAVSPEYQEIKVNVVDGAGVRLTTDTTSTVTIVVKDGNGNPISFDALTGISTDGNYKLVVKNASGNWVVYKTTATATNVVNKGQIVFGIASQKADTLSYEFQANGTAGLEASTDGSFVAGEADHVKVVAADPFVIKGNNASVTGVTAQVVDQFDNKVTTYSGSMTFKIVKGSDYATLQDSTAEITNGEATVLAKSKSTTSNGFVWVQAATDLNADGVVTDGTNSTDNEWSTVNTNSNAAATLEVRNVVTPVVESVIFTDVDGVEANYTGAATDKVVITFERSTNAPSLDAASFVSGDAFGAGAAFEWSAEGTVLTITLGDTPTFDNSAADIKLAAGVDLHDDVYGDQYDVTNNLYTH